ncbi:MAG: superoxide dismutase [Thermoanaerobaculum sp.]
MAAAAVVSSLFAEEEKPASKLSLELPPLPYLYDALEPYIDAETMRLHHDKHHAAYVAGLAKAVEKVPSLARFSLEELLRSPEKVPEEVRVAVRNHGGGHYNHTLFWQCLAPGAPAAPEGELAQAIARDFGSFENFKEAFTQKALSVFGSGWAWLVFSSGKLSVTSTPNQDTPLASGQTPILGLDLWEHAYYLKYQWRRAEYVAAFWHVVNWRGVAARFRKLAKA